MKNLFLLLLTLASFQVFAKEGGNGGGTVICGDKVELYDFYEGKKAHQIQVWNVNKDSSVEEYIERALNHIKSDIPEVHPKVSEMVRKILSTSPEELFIEGTIPVIRDADTSVIEPGCEYVQAANWSERFDKLFIRKDLFERMSNLDRAGLIVHEAIYKLSRDTKIANSNSDLVRKVVAKIFSDETLSEPDAEVISSPKAVIEATRPMCNWAVKMFGDFERIAQGASEEILVKLKDLSERTAETCLRHCLDPEVRRMCESHLPQ